MKPDSARRPKRQIAVFAETHQRLSELATGLRLPIADLLEKRFGKVIEREYRAMLAAKVSAQGGK